MFPKQSERIASHNSQLLGHPEQTQFIGRASSDAFSHVRLEDKPRAQAKGPRQTQAPAKLRRPNRALVAASKAYRANKTKRS